MQIMKKSLLEEIADYDMLMDGSQYRFEDLLYPGYGFKDSGSSVIHSSIQNRET